jgi:hypothetical protein
MRKGVYAVYKGREYRANPVGNGNFLLISNDIKDLKYGFTPAPRNKGYFIKTVTQIDLDEVYRITPKAIYKGDEFGVQVARDDNGVEITNRILLVTPYKDIGDKHGFYMREPGVYLKEVGLDEVDKLFEIKKPFPVN